MVRPEFVFDISLILGFVRWPDFVFVCASASSGDLFVGLVLFFVVGLISGFVYRPDGLDFCVSLIFRLCVGLILGFLIQHTLTAFDV